jgi:ribose transport system permease protein
MASRGASAPVTLAPSGADGSSAGSRRLRLKRAGRALLDNIVWLILVLCLLVFSVAIRGFFSWENYVNILHQSVFIAILGIAEAFVLISGNMDLSVEATAAASAILSVWLCASSPYASGLRMNTWAGLAIVLGIGALIGGFNAFVVLKLKVDSFLVTLSTYIAVRGLAVLITGGMGMNGLPAAFRFVDTAKLARIPLMVFLMILFYLGFSFLLSGTRFGRHVYIIGGNKTAAYNFGIPVGRVLLWVFVLSGVVAAVTGWFMAARTNGATASMATGFLFEVLAAVVIGGVSLGGGMGSLVGVFAGALILSTIHSALNITAASPFLTEVMRGLLILVAVVLDALRRMFR